MKRLAVPQIVAVGLLAIGVVVCGLHTLGHDGVSVADSSWDLVVLGRIDFNLLNQFAPTPHVQYTRVLAGQVPSGRGEGQLALTAVDSRLLPEGGAPVYQSQREEICFLKRVAVPGYPGADVYKVVAVNDATPENLSRFRSR